MKKRTVGVLIALIMVLGMLPTMAFAISVSPRMLDFGSLTEGYTAAPAAKSITVGAGSDGEISIKTPENFHYSHNLENLTSPSFQPQTELPVGTYNENVTISNNSGESVTVELKFTVTAAHEHNWSADWSSDGTAHWHECEAENCPITDNDKKDGYAVHSVGTAATCAAAAVCEVCGQSYGNTDQNNHSDLQHVAAKAATSSAAGNIEYWYCDGCDKYFEDEDAEEEFENGRDDTVIPKLPAITEGGAQTVTVGEKKALTFTSDAAFAEFVRVEIDGVTLDGKNYTVKEGSTIVTLNADYVAALAAGEHTLNIVSEGGTATAKFTVTEKAAETTDKPDKADKPVVNEKAKAPKTGDSGNGVLWLALLLVSGGAVTAATLVSRKKKYNR